VQLPRDGAVASVVKDGVVQVVPAGGADLTLRRHHAIRRVLVYHPHRTAFGARVHGGQLRFVHLHRARNLVVVVRIVFLHIVELHPVGRDEPRYLLVQGVQVIPVPGRLSPVSQVKLQCHLEEAARGDDDAGEVIAPEGRQVLLRGHPRPLAAGPVRLARHVLGNALQLRVQPPQENPPLAELKQDLGGLHVQHPGSRVHAADELASERQ